MIGNLFSNSLATTLTCIAHRIACLRNNGDFPRNKFIEPCVLSKLIESKTSFTFPVFTALDGGEPVAVQVTADEQGKAALQDLLDRTCGTR